MKLRILTWIITAVILITGCSKDESLPVVTTNDLSEITGTSAVCGGTVSSDGGNDITARGVCWSEHENPTISDSITTDGTGDGNFTSIIHGLTENTTYYIRAYATSSVGTAYGEQKVFTTTEVIDFEILTGTTTDQQGNDYATITINNQTWMASNLRTTIYNDNSDIPLVTDITQWSNLSTPAQRVHSNIVEVDSIQYFGRVYNWYAVNTGKLCPVGWHVASADDWENLIQALIQAGYNFDGSTTENKIAKAIASETGWEVYGNEIEGDVGKNPLQNNSTGFSGYPGGYVDANGVSYSFHYNVYWWTSTEYNTTGATSRNISTYNNYVGMDEQTDKRNGFYVRCVKDVE
ncbi:MAG TPA: fibrobacter succinogenes major paralogous domain-containing protein [Bacteroidales bacterium]|nr:fibrobacter succinogenes major paralogous domain-containing protein [Bacteroidales bacterium]